jgi:hypothetical protein
MLLDLLNHHQDLFLAAIEPLIWRRDCRSLGALAGSCRQLRDFLAHDVSFYTHINCMLPVLHDILAIDRVILRYNGTVDTTIMFIDDKYVSYMYSDEEYSDKSLAVYTNNMELKIYDNLKDIDIFHGDCTIGNVEDVRIPNSILKYIINNGDRIYGYEYLIDSNK